MNEAAHDIECASAAYAALIERAEGRGDRKHARELRREWSKYRAQKLIPQDRKGANQ